MGSCWDVEPRRSKHGIEIVVLELLNGAAQMIRKIEGIAFTVILAAWAFVLIASKVRELATPDPTGAVAARVKRHWPELTGTRSPVLGVATGRFKIVEFSDYQCPFCALADAVLFQFVSHHKGDAALYRYDMPLREIHRHAYAAAIAAGCAEKQGVTYPYQSLLFQHQKEFATLDWSALAGQAGVADRESFSKCIHEESPRSNVEFEETLAKSYRIGGTPTLFINGVRLTQRVSEETLESLYRQLPRAVSH
jgi:protein-disulfide isomerase